MTEKMTKKQRSSLMVHSHKVTQLLVSHAPEHNVMLEFETINKILNDIERGSENPFGQNRA